MQKEKRTVNDGTRKKPGKLKKFLFVVAGLFVMFVLIGVFSEDDTEPTQTAKVSETDDSVAEPVQTEKESGLETEKDVEADSITEQTDETDITGMTDAEDGQSSVEDTSAENDIPSDGEDEYISSITEYSFKSVKNGKKIVEIYEKALDADRDEFICLTEEEKIHMFSNKEVWYKKSLDADHAPFRYYGDVNRDGRPDGMGMLVRNWDELYRESSDIQRWTRLFMDEENYYEQEKENVCVEIEYIGEFKDGFKEGYGIDFGVEGIYEIPIIAYEGEFEHGKRHGSGTAYLGLAGGTYDEEFNNMLAEMYLAEYSDTINSGLLFPTVAKSNLSFEGMYKEGGRDGEGKEYYTGENENHEPCLKYEGEFENSHYSGTGTLYFEDGKVWYKGEFKNGKYDGKGILYDEQGKVLHEGKFKDGEVE
ncbi:MAG: hypothetical protein K2P76_15710 [Lachnospiraceae bacterium]|nr:hypothetical protein [Lachnospiraceae bacterium]